MAVVSFARQGRSNAQSFPPPGHSREGGNPVRPQRIS